MNSSELSTYPREHEAADESIKDLLPRLERGANLLTGAGLRIGGDNRLLRGMELLRSIPKTGVRVESLSDRTMAAVEGAVLADILDHCPAFLALPDWKEHFELLVSGPFYPLSEGDDPARGKQFELWLAARALSLGCTVKLGNPDAFISDEYGHFVVEAKRLQGEGSIQRNIEKASKQIHKSGLRGMIALDVSRLIGMHDALVVADSLEGGHQIIREKMTRLSGEGEFRRWVRNKQYGNSVIALTAVVFSAICLKGTGEIIPIRKTLGGPIDPSDRVGAKLFARMFAPSLA